MANSINKNEKKFFDALNDIFIWAKIEWKWGYINLMNIKSKYYKEHIYWAIYNFIEQRFNTNNSNREELFARLYTFFNRYFNETWSIYFQYTPLKENVYERVYSNKDDVSLFYKTHMLYYVKSERIFKSIDLKVEDEDKFQDFHFNFDVSQLELAKNNEKKEIVFEFLKIENKKICLNVLYSTWWKKTKIDDILKAVKKEDENLKIDEKLLSKALKTYKKQAEVDFFINKDAKKFLKEQFNLWYYQYVFGDWNNWEFNISDFDDRRIRELQWTKEIAYKIIDFISQFEDELVKVWNKPKFVRNSNYVLTLDKLENNTWLINKIISHKNFKEQENEWKELWYNLEKYSKEKIIFWKSLNKDFKYLTIDTKYFEDIKYDILDVFDNLDDELNWVLVNSDNYQALNTIQNKYRWSIDLCYIDPPFNTWSDFEYKDWYQDSTWLTLMNNRLSFCDNIMKKTWNFYLHLDHNANYYWRILLNNNLWKQNFRNEIFWHYTSSRPPDDRYWAKVDTIFMYAVSEKSIFKPILKENILDKSKYPLEDEKWHYKIVKWWKKYFKEFSPIDNNWHIPLENVMSKEIQKINWKTFATQKPVELLTNIINSSSNTWDYVLDYFTGTWTTISVAHRMNRKWIWVEMWSHFYDINIPRMKKVLFWKWVISENKFSNWEWWWFFKYYSLEQYEHALEKLSYWENTIFVKEENKDIFSNYIFLKDEKFTKAIELDLENWKIKIDLTKIYDDIDIPETLSNITWKNIKKISKDSVVLEEIWEIKYSKIPLELIKPLIWWK